MRTLLLTRGMPASGKDYWIKQNNLEPYTLSADNIRLLMQSPTTNIDGELCITQKNDKQVWKLLFQLLEQRMERGEFIVVNATHYKMELLQRYYNLIKQYRYRAFVVDFTDVPLETCIERNRQREKYKFVPENVLHKMYTVFEAEKNSSACKEVSNKFTIIKPDKVQNMLKKEYLRKDYTDLYEKVVVFGDIHGCYEPLKNYFEENTFRDNYLYVFTGDYLDRGIQNLEVLQFLQTIYKKSNVVLLEGNHECLHKDTEILTDMGWVKIYDIVENKLKINPYTYNIEKRLIELDMCNNYHKKFQEKMIEIETNNSKQIVSYNHDVLVDNVKIPAHKIIENNIEDLNKKILPCSFAYNNNYDISNDMLRLLTWIVCDGTLCDSNKNKPELAPKLRIQFKLSKINKIEILTNLLKNMNIKYTIKSATKCNQNKLQPYLIRIYGDIAKDIFKIFNNKKQFPDFFKQLSKTQCDIVLDTISKTDGSIANKRILFYTGNINDLNIINEMCIKNGYSFKYKKNISGFNKEKYSYSCSITKNWFWRKDANIKSVEYNDYSYCITTNNGTLITRINGKCAITGNCHIRKYSSKNCDLSSIRSDEFKNNTIPQIESFDKKELRQISRKFSQLEYFKFGDYKYVICHGGIPCIPTLLMSTDELIKGVGKYEDEQTIGENFEKNTDNQHILIHGHRNIFDKPIKYSDYHYNLCDSPENGNSVRIIEIDKNGDIKEILQPNKIFKENAKRITHLDVVNINTDNDVIKQLNESKLIQKKVLDNGIISYNFTRKCFYDKIWNDLTCRARGLFIDSETDNVIARGYSKFFSVSERKNTELPELYKTFKFPVTTYLKENGFIAFVSYNPKTDDLFIASKSTDKGDYVDMIKEELFKPEIDTSFIKQFCKNNNVTLIFECINKDKDPHIIKYDKNKLVLLDAVNNQLEDDFIPYFSLQILAQNIGVQCKVKLHEFSTWEQFKNWYDCVSKDDLLDIEGYVIQDSNNFRVKYKTNYYKFWKFMRSIKDKMSKGQNIRPSFSTETEIKVYNYMRSLTLEELKSKSIIDIRDEYNLTN